MDIVPKPSTLPTRIFKSGNSLAVRIPKDMMPADVPEDAEINYSGGVWTIRPVYKRKLTGLAEKFAAFSPSFMSQGREPQEQDGHDWALKSLPKQGVTKTKSAKPASPQLTKVKG